MTAGARVVAFTPTLADTLAAQRLGARHTLWRYGLWIAIFVGTACFVMATDAHASASAIIGYTAALAAGCAVLLALMWGLEFPRRVARHYRQQASLRQAYRVSWDEDGLLAETAQSRVLVRWADYVRRREDDAVILLYQSDLLFQFLPKRAFDAEQIATLRPFLDRVPRGRRRAIPRP